MDFTDTLETERDVFRAQINNPQIGDTLGPLVVIDVIGEDIQFALPNTHKTFMRSKEMIIDMAEARWRAMDEIGPEAYYVE